MRALAPVRLSSTGDPRQTTPTRRYCFAWACCPLEGAVCCDDHQHCCPSQLPVCDATGGRCKAGPDMEEGAEPWGEQEPAFWHWSGWLRTALARRARRWLN